MRTIEGRGKLGVGDFVRSGCIIVCLFGLLGCAGAVVQEGPVQYSNLHRAKVFLAAGDFRRALEACQAEVAERPSVSGYVALTYVYSALDAYLESLAKADRWVAVELLAQSLSVGRSEELLDSPDILARIAKELIQSSARKQGDVSAAMAARLDEQEVAVLWRQQQVWRQQYPEKWWFGVPKEWGW